jgi:hypothetical protein
MTARERQTVIQCMADNFENQDDPKVGIFWYDEKADELFGVTKINANELQFNSNGYKTISTLYKSWWQSQQKKALAKGKALGILQNDYTAIPRGRIFQKKDGVFQLMCGSWINDDIENLVKEEFDLQNVPFERIIDTHWEIGHGWSEEYL